MLESVEFWLPLLQKPAENPPSGTSAEPRRRVPAIRGPASVSDAAQVSPLPPSDLSHFLQLVSVISQDCARRHSVPVSKTGASRPGRVSVSGGQMMSLGGNLPKTVYHLPSSPPPLPLEHTPAGLC